MIVRDVLMWPGMTAPRPDATGGRLSIFDCRGELFALGRRPVRPGDFFAPHDICAAYTQGGRTSGSLYD